MHGIEIKKRVKISKETLTYLHEIKSKTLNALLSAREFRYTLLNTIHKRKNIIVMKVVSMTL